MSKGAMLQKLIDQANKKYGDGTIIRGGEYPVLQRMSTGVFIWMSKSVVVCRRAE